MLLWSVLIHMVIMVNNLWNHRMVWIERDLKRPSGSNSCDRGTFQTRLLNNWSSLSICHSWSRRIFTLECCLVSLNITYLVEDVYEFPSLSLLCFWGLHLENP